MQRLQAFHMYGSIGMSTPSLHREFTDSLIITTHCQLLIIGAIVTVQYDFASQSLTVLHCLICRQPLIVSVYMFCLVNVYVI